MISLTILFGILSYVFIVITVVLGILMTKGWRVRKYHKYFAWVSIILATIHAAIVIKRYYF